MTAARVKVWQAEGRRGARTPTNRSAVRAVAVVRVRGARQCDNGGCDNKSCGSQCNTHGSRLSSFGLDFTYSGITPLLSQTESSSSWISHGRTQPWFGGMLA